MSFDERIEKLNEVQRGWINAFRMASIQNKLVELDSLSRTWLRELVTKPTSLLYMAPLEG